MGKASRDVKRRYKASAKGRASRDRELAKLRAVTTAKRANNLLGPVECEWRPVVGNPYYEVSEYGDVRRAIRVQTRSAGCLLKGETTRGGYRRFILYNGGGHRAAKKLWAHRLVAEAFIGPQPTPEHAIAHWDGDRQNNHYTNLRWATVKENAADRDRHGTQTRGSKNPAAKLDENKVVSLRREYAEAKAASKNASLKFLEERYGITRGTILDVVNFRRWQHVGA